MLTPIATDASPRARSTKLGRDGRREVAGCFERVDRFERIRAVAVVLRRAGGDPFGELLGARYQSGAGRGMGC
jgi:hypothetical protein